MFPNSFLAGVMPETTFVNLKLDFIGLPYLFHHANEMTAQCVLLTATAGKYSFGNETGDSFLHVAFDADPYRCTQNTMLDKYTQYCAITYSILFKQSKGNQPGKQKSIQPVYTNRIDVIDCHDLMAIAGKQCNSSAVHDVSQTQYGLKYIASSQ
jgi:hypothetical protein